jgi:hypothetical protein
MIPNRSVAREPSVRPRLRNVAMVEDVVQYNSSFFCFFCKIGKLVSDIIDNYALKMQLQHSGKGK